MLDKGIIQRPTAHPGGSCKKKLADFLRHNKCANHKKQGGNTHSEVSGHPRSSSYIHWKFAIGTEKTYEPSSAIGA